MNWDNLTLDQVRQLGVCLKWAEFWAERKVGRDYCWAQEINKLAQAQSEFRWIYEQKTGNPPHVREICMYSVSTQPPAAQAEPQVPV